MTRLPVWALVPVLVILAACSGQATTQTVTPTAGLATAESSATIPSSANTIATPLPQVTPESTPAPSTPTPASPTAAATSTPAHELPTTEPGPEASLTIIVAPIQMDTPEYDRSGWKHWIDEDGDCQDARQEALISESLVEVTFESERKCRVATGRWYGAFTGTYVEAPEDLDIDHLVPLKNAHDSGGWAWSAARKQEYANYLGDPDHLVAVTKGANRSKGAKGPEAWRPPDEGYWCEYATVWTEVKMEWELTMTQQEVEAVIEMLDTCEDPVEVIASSADGGSESDESERPAAGDATATPTPVSGSESQGTSSVYASCEDAAEAGETRVRGFEGGGRGFPKEMVPSARDGDGDGVVCERQANGPSQGAGTASMPRPAVG